MDSVVSVDESIFSSEMDPIKTFQEAKVYLDDLERYLYKGEKERETMFEVQ